MSFLSRARSFFAFLGILYAILLVLLVVPAVQTNVVYLHKLKFPWFSQYDAPEKYGMAPNKTYNLKISTPDGESIGAWYTLADPYYNSLSLFPPASDEHITQSLKRYPTMLFLHGNAATRAFKARVQQYQAFSSRLAVNVLAIDYRGFGDSTGTPTEAGVVIDARAAWDWLLSRGARPENVIIIGHSLGTGIGGRLASILSDEGVKYRGVVLMSPFSSIEELLKTYSLLGFIPLIKPLQIFPYAASIVMKALKHRFETLGAVPKLKGNIIIVHAENDWDIPYTHSEVLFNAFIEPYLPTVTFPPMGTVLSTEEWAYLNGKLEERTNKRNGLTAKMDIRNFGTLERFVEDDQRRQVVLLKTLQGNHDYVGVQEGLHDVIRTTFELPSGSLV